MIKENEQNKLYIVYTDYEESRTHLEEAEYFSSFERACKRANELKKELLSDREWREVDDCTGMIQEEVSQLFLNVRTGLEAYIIFQSITVHD